MQTLFKILFSFSWLKFQRIFFVHVHFSCLQVILVGNKCDMEDERVISYERGKQLADSLGLEFFETSAKENINVRVSSCLFMYVQVYAPWLGRWGSSQAYLRKNIKQLQVTLQILSVQNEDNSAQKVCSSLTCSNLQNEPPHKHRGSETGGEI